MRDTLSARWGLVAPIALGLASTLLLATGAAQASGSTWYAYAGGGITGSVGSCPQSSTPASECSMSAVAASATAGSTIYLASQGSTYSGSWTLPSGATIEPAPDVSAVTLDGTGQTSPVLTATAGVTTVSDVTIQNGADGALASAAGDTGTLTVQGVSFLDNSSNTVGAAIDDQNGAGGSLTVSGSTFNGNHVTALGLLASGSVDGGAIYVSAGSAAISHSTFTGNFVTNTLSIVDSETGDGGAIYNDNGTVSVTDSTFGGGNGGNYVSSSVAAAALTSNDIDGGAIYSGGGSLAVSDSTFAGNDVGGTVEVGLGSDIQDGGAIYTAGGTLTVASSTFSGGTEPSVGTLSVSGTSNVGTSIYANGSTWVAANVFGDATSGNSCGHANTSSWTSQGRNVGDASCERGVLGDTSATAAALDLQPLAYNGGPTETQMLGSGSPAIGDIPNGDSVSLNGTADVLCATTDQRGMSTPANAACDSGATQSASPVLSVTAPSVQITAGASVPALAPSYSGFVLGQNADSLATGPTCAVQGDPSMAGSYPIVCSGAANVAAGTALQPNTFYAFSYTPGTLTVDAASTGGNGNTGGGGGGGTDTTTTTTTAPGTSTDTNAGDGSGGDTSATNTGGTAGTDGSTGSSGTSGSTGSAGTSGSSGSGGSNGSSGAAASNGSGSSSSTGDQAPRNTSHPVLAGIARAGSSLTCAAGAWAGTPTPRYSYQWSLDGSPIAAATSPVYRVPTTDEGESLTCTITATNAAGARTVTTSPTRIPIKTVAGCPAATGSVSGETLGLAQLGMTVAQVRHAYLHHHSVTKADQQRFCLTPRAVRVAYVTTSLAQRLPAAIRGRYVNHVGLILTASTHYQIHGVRSGTAVSVAAKRLRLDKFVVGKNDWYLANGKSVELVFKARHGVIEEIGLADRALTRTHADRRIFLRSF